MNASIDFVDWSCYKSLNVRALVEIPESDMAVERMARMATGFGRFLKNALGHEIGSGNVVSEQRDVGDFDEVTLSGIGHLSITQTGSESLTIEAEDNILPLLTSEVRGHRLVLGTEPGAHFSPKKPIRYTLTVKELRDIRISGAGNVEVSALGAPSLRLEISGAGNMTITGLAADRLEVTMSGAGSATCAGEARDQEVRISGAGSCNAADLTSVTASVTISGTGSAHLRVSERLDARVSGVGSITYRGNPTVRKSVSGVGHISQRA